MGCWQKEEDGGGRGSTQRCEAGPTSPNRLFNNGNSARTNLHEACWEIPSCHGSGGQKGNEGSRWKRSYHILNSWTHAKSNDSLSFFFCTLKTETAGLKMGPCHSLLAANLLCPQSCFLPSHCTHQPRCFLYCVCGDCWLDLVFSAPRSVCGRSTLATREPEQCTASAVSANGASAIHRHPSDEMQK